MTDPQVRIGHCSPDAPAVDVAVDGNTAFEGVEFRDISDYTPLSSGSHDVQVMPAGTDDAVIDTSLRLDRDTSYTVLATGTLDDIEATVFEDEPGEVPSGKAHVRFIHASPDAPRVDIAVRDGPKLFRRVKFRRASDYEQVDAGTYDLDVLAMGSDDVALAVDGLGFDSGNAYTAIAVGQVEAGTLDALLVEDAIAAMAAD
jgi:hypothetical protein